VKAWGGRFAADTSPLMERFSASIHFDHVLYEQDIEGSKAHADMLCAQGILEEQEKKSIVDALEEIRQEIASGKLSFTAEKEDIHMHIEARLVEKIGQTGKKLHTGRSRNDQVSLDMRMFVRQKLGEMDGTLKNLLSVLLRKAEEEKGTILPGYTHLQRAQVVTFGHYLLAHYFTLKRDRARLELLRSLNDTLPLGAGALAGSTIPLDREMVREQLGFAKVSENSMETVGDRDFVIDTVFGLTMIMVHLSRFAEDLIIFSTQEFAFVALPDEVCTGSSLMPHKKNPDAMELTRGKSARVIGDLMSLLTLLKGLPLTYNRDLQEDKEPLFHAIETTGDCLAIVSLCVSGLALNRERMAEATRQGYIVATEIAEYLTKKGVPFREAHTIVGQMVRHCEDRAMDLSGLTLPDLKRFSEHFEEDTLALTDPLTILEQRHARGAASINEVERVIEEEKAYLRR
jgi:argininosuccinate lyase